MSAQNYYERMLRPIADVLESKDRLVEAKDVLIKAYEDTKSADSVRIDWLEKNKGVEVWRSGGSGEWMVINTGGRIFLTMATGKTWRAAVEAARLGKL